MGMEDVLRIDKILDFCDVPQLFVARDAFDTLYLCLLYDDETVYRYTGIRISTRRLESFLAGKADLRLLYLQPENEHEYYDVVFQSGEYQKTLLKESVLLEDKLPAEGYVLSHKIYGNYYGIFFFLAFLQMLTAVVYGGIII